MWGCLTIFIVYIFTLGGLLGGLEAMGVDTESMNPIISVILLIVSWFISMFIMKIIVLSFGFGTVNDVKNNRVF